METKLDRTLVDAIVAYLSRAGEGFAFTSHYGGPHPQPDTSFVDKVRKFDEEWKNAETTIDKWNVLVKYGTGPTFNEKQLAERYIEDGVLSNYKKIGIHRKQIIYIYETIYT
jgi:hypothetical protein